MRAGLEILKIPASDFLFRMFFLGHFEVVKKLETPYLIFEGMDGGERNIVDYFQFQGAFKQNISEEVGYVEIIDRTLDRKVGTIQNTRTFLISIVALVVSIYFASN